MIRIKDRIILGAISGMLAGIPGRIINKHSYAKGLTDIRYNPLAAELFLSKKNSKSPKGIFIGAIVNNINLAANGVILTYILSATGKDYKVLKGIGMGAFSWVLVDGLIGSQMLKTKSRKSLSPPVHLFDHLLYGILCSTLITSFGDERLFPSKNQSFSKEIPLIDTGIKKVEESNETEYS